MSLTAVVAQPNTREVEKELHTLFEYINEFRAKNGGVYPANTTEIIKLYYQEDGIEGLSKVRSSLRKAFEKEEGEEAKKPSSMYLIPYTVTNKRPDASPVGSHKPMGTYDVLGFTSRYVKLNPEVVSGQEIVDAKGNYVILKATGEVNSIPFDSIFYVFEDDKALVAYPNQAGIPTNRATTFAEFWGGDGLQLPPTGKLLVQTAPTNKRLVVDNGGPESLVSLSRLLSIPNRYGVNREKLWQIFDPAQPEFTLADIQSGATKLGLTTQVQKQTLAQLQASGTPALLFLQDDGRIVTLTAVDDDRAVVIDRGVTQNVERSVLEKRYSGEALVPTKALTQNAAIVANDAVREVKLPSLDAEVPQQFVLRNAGTTPITLQLEYPLLGVTESKLSQDVIAPGETATLDLKVKWRSILKAPYQNVLVSIQTNDPIVPRLQLAVLLTPPEKASN